MMTRKMKTEKNRPIRYSDIEPVIMRCTSCMHVHSEGCSNKTVCRENNVNNCVIMFTFIVYKRKKKYLRPVLNEFNRRLTLGLLLIFILLSIT